MLKSRLYEYLKQYLGEYLYGLQEDQLEVAVLSGHLNFTNANFKPTKVNELLLSLGLPVHLKAGFIGRLQVKYHYLSMLSNPIEVTIDDLFLILGPVLLPPVEPAHDRMETFASDEELSDCELFGALGPGRNPKDTSSSESDEDLQPEDMASNRSMHGHVPRPASPEPIRARTPNRTNPGRAVPPQAQPFSRSKPPPKPEKETTLGLYIQTVLKTLTLTVRNLHIRYEDDIYPYLSPFSCGICFESLTIKTDSMETAFTRTDSSDTSRKSSRKEVVCKDCSLTNFVVYMSPLSGMLIPTSLWEATLSSPIGIFDALPAYEIRELILQESRDKFNGSRDNFISPVTLQCWVQLGDKGVNVCLPLPAVTVKMTSAMAESMNSFMDYFVNVQLWGHMRRYRPYERINTGTHRGESQLTKARRKKVVRKWFIHAFRFIRYKKKLLQLVQARKEKLAKAISKRNSRNLYQRQLPTETLPLCENIAPKYSERASKSPFNFLNSKPRVIPGTTGVDLSAAVNAYNKRILGELCEEKKPVKVPIVRENCEFPSAIVGSEIGIRVESVKLVFGVEGEAEVEIETQKFGLNVCVEREKIMVEMQVGEWVVEVTEGKTVQVVKCGKREVVKEEVVKAGLFSKPVKKVTVAQAGEVAFRGNLTYTPDAFRGPGEAFPSDNMYELKGSLAPLKVVYSHQILGTIGYIHSCFAQEEGRTSHHREPQVDVGKRITALQKRLRRLVRACDRRFVPISCAVSLSIGTSSISLLDKRNTSLCEISIPANQLELLKQDENTKMSVLGFSLVTSHTFRVLYSFITVSFRQNIGQSLGDRYSHVKKWAHSTFLHS